MTNKRRILVTFVVLILSYFVFSSVKYQELINDGSLVADEQCLKVNPLIIERKNRYLASMKVIQASGSSEEYWNETNKYLEVSKKYLETQTAWLSTQKDYIDRWDFKLFVPSYIQEAAKAQYRAREADTKATEALVELFETFKTTDLEHQRALTETVLDETKKSTDADNEYNRIWDTSQGKFDLRSRFTKVPQTKCPPENFNIPDVKDFFNPESIPTNNPLS